MGAQRRRHAASLTEALHKEPYTFDFDQAIKILESLRPGAEALGEGTDPAAEPVQLKSNVYLSAPPGDLQTLTQEEDRPPELKINFLGLAGLQGPLPLPYTEKLLERIKAKDTAWRDFLDIFNHRLASIFYRIRKKYFLSLDRRGLHESPLASCLLSFVGVKPAWNQDAMRLPTESLLFYSGTFWQNPKSAAGLRGMLHHYFQVPVQIKTLQGRWVPIDTKHVTRIGVNGQFQMLGQTAALGERFWDASYGVSLILGPLSFEQFRTFLKNGNAYPALVDLTQLYLGKHHNFSLNLRIKAEDVCETRLDGASALGWTSWLKHREFSDDDGQVTLYPG